MYLALTAGYVGVALVAGTPGSCMPKRSGNKPKQDE
jgi:hypothetical protein